MLCEECDIDIVYSRVTNFCSRATIQFTRSNKQLFSTDYEIVEYNEFSNYFLVRLSLNKDLSLFFEYDL